MRYHREPRRRVQIGLLSLAMLMPLAAHADSWQQTQREARGQTVWFNAWGRSGGEPLSRLGER